MADPTRTSSILRHALGLDNAKLPYRNYFVAGQADLADCRDLAARGLMSEAETDRVGTCFNVTPEGEAYLADERSKAHG